VRVIERVKVGKRGDGTLIRVEDQANWWSFVSEASSTRSICPSLGRSRLGLQGVKSLGSVLLLLYKSVVG
jgi:hypothetical protein